LQWAAAAETVSGISVKAEQAARGEAVAAGAGII